MSPLRHTRPARAARRWLSRVLPYRKMAGGRERLDVQYARGSWDYLRSLDELARFSVLAGYCHYLKPNGRILEIGCGEGILQERLDPARYARYVGVDISEEAVRRAQARTQAQRSQPSSEVILSVAKNLGGGSEPPSPQILRFAQDDTAGLRGRFGSTAFVCADAAAWEPGEVFDLIAFNECLEYFDDPVGLVRRYEPSLAPDGAFLVSMFAGLDTTRTRRIWRWLEEVYEVADATRVTNRKGLTWVLEVLRPCASA